MQLALNTVQPLGSISIRVILSDGLAASVADAQDNNRIALDGEDNTVHMRLSSVEQMPYLKGKRRIFRG
jgi:hypothetical protein